MMLAPIVLFTYNRPTQTLRTLEALAKNKLANESVLYVFLDGPKDAKDSDEVNRIKKVRDIVCSRQWCGKVELMESTYNKGLAKSIIEGVTGILDKYEAIIVLEDDILTATGFLTYMNNALNLYKDENKVMQVAGYLFPVRKYYKKESAYFLPMTSSWGWATWRRAWSQFDALATGYEELKVNEHLAYAFNLDGTYPYDKMLFEQMEQGTINSWAIRWWWTVFKSGGVVLYPDFSFVSNIGFGEDATHTTVSNLPIFKLDSSYKINSFPLKVSVDYKFYEQIKQSLRNQFRYRRKKISLFRKALRFLTLTSRSQ